MMPPDNRKPPAGTGGISEGDLLTGDQANPTENPSSVAEGALETVVGLLLTSPTVQDTLALLDGLPAPIFDPVMAWWLTSIRLSAEAGVRPNPWSAIDRANRAGIEAPPALRGLPLAAGWELVGKVSAVPFVVVHDLVLIVRAAHVRRTTEMANERLTAANWRGELVDLLALWQREAGAVFAVLTEAVSNNG